MKEAKVASEPEALVYLFRELGVLVNRIGLDAGPLSQWLHVGLSNRSAGDAACEGGIVGDDDEDGPQGWV